FWYHNVQRAVGGAEALATHPWWFYGPRFAYDFLPATLLIPVAVWLTVRRPEVRSDSDARMGLIWFGTVLLLLSLSRFKRAASLLPAYPGAAIWLGCVGERAVESWRSPRLAGWLRAGAIGVLALVVVSWGVFLRTAVPRMDADR